MTSANDVGDARIVVFHALISIPSAFSFSLAWSLTSPRAIARAENGLVKRMRRDITPSGWKRGPGYHRRELLIVGVHVARNVIFRSRHCRRRRRRCWPIDDKPVSRRVRENLSLSRRESDGNAWEKNFILIINFNDVSSCLLTWEVKIAQNECANLRREFHLYREIGSKPCET